MTPDPRKKGQGWVGVDLDGTLAYSDPDGGYKGDSHIGKPILPMVQRVRKMLRDGKDVRIFTARPNNSRPAIRRFCNEHFGKVLPITNVKDRDMIELYDDRAIQVERNTGNLIGGQNG